MAITVASFPATIDGCMATWSETQISNVIRTDMENLTVKVRRRTTGIHRIASVSVTLKAEVYQDFMDFYNVSCRQGVDPARFTNPLGKKEVWRITAPPQIEWVDKKAFSVAMELEQLPMYRTL